MSTVQVAGIGVVGSIPSTVQIAGIGAVGTVVTAVAGPDQIAEPFAPVTLTGGGSHPGTWTQTAGTSVTLIPVSAGVVMFTAPAGTGEDLTFDWATTDGVTTATDPVTVVVNPHQHWARIAGFWVATRPHVRTPGPPAEPPFAFDGGTSSDTGSGILDGGTAGTGGIDIVDGGGSVSDVVVPFAALSGAGMPGVGGVNRVANGDFGVWRGTPATIATTWQDVNYTAAATGSPHLVTGGTYAAWAGHMDLTIGGIWSAGNGGNGGITDTWAMAAAGTLDARWTTILNNVKTRWGTRTSTLYLRFCHEVNAGWYDWRCRTTEVANFITGWRRFHALKQSIFPAAKLVFNTIAEKNGIEYDWRTIWPGDGYVDVYSTDYYADAYKHVFVDGGAATDSFGGPRTLEGHRAFAEAHGVPLAISEWGVDPVFGTGDDLNFIQHVYDFRQAHAGDQAGQVLYESYFNETKSETDRRALYVVPGEPTAKLADPGRTATEFPLAAARYQLLF